jgi:hypothetical protein
MSARQSPTVLTSWKEIAAYLGKGVRTVQRWEREFGLPVRRPNGNSHTVYASCEELQAWLASWSQRQRSNSENPVPGNGASASGNGGFSHLLDSVQQSCKKHLVNAQAAMELRKLQQQLVGDLRQHAIELAEKCQAIGLRVTNQNSKEERPPERTGQRK